jgi:hypothetical protein
VRLRFFGYARANGVHVELMLRESPVTQVPKTAEELAAMGSGRSSEARTGRGLAAPRHTAIAEEAVRPGSVYAFVPAHGESNVGAVHHPLTRTWAEDLGLSVLLADFDCSHGSVWQPFSELRSLDGFTRGALVRREGNREVLNASSAGPRDIGRWIECASRRYDVVAADLTPASEEIALAVMRASASIFIVSDSDRSSLELARDKAAWIRSQDSGKALAELCALLLRPTPGGLRPDMAEDLAGIPVCSLIQNTVQIKRLAAWLTLDREPAQLAG